MIYEIYCMASGCGVISTTGWAGGSYASGPTTYFIVGISTTRSMIYKYKNRMGC